MVCTLFETPCTYFEVYSPHDYSKSKHKEFECVEPKYLKFQKLEEIRM